MVATVSACRASVRIAGLCHEFELHGQSLPVLDVINLEAAAGEFIALLGPSGCGKSKIDGPDPSRILVFQDPTLFPWRTVRQNVALGLETRGLLRAQDGRVDDVLRQVGLDGFDNAYPHQLSGGMVQRAALARAFVNEPSIMLLDEPLTNLDGLTCIALQAELVALWKRQRFTAFLVTHDVDEAFYLAERVLVLSRRPARILADVTVDLPYPQHRGNPRFAELRQCVLEELGLRARW